MFEELAEYEAAIRADERLKIAREVDAMRENRGEWPMLTGMGAAVLVEVAERIREPRA